MNRFSAQPALKVVDDLAGIFAWPRSSTQHLTRQLSTVAMASLVSQATITSNGEFAFETNASLDFRPVLAGGKNGLEERFCAEIGDVLHVLKPLTIDAKKFVAYIPVEHLNEVRSAIFSAGAGRIGEYDQCGFVLTGTGSFRGLEGTNPAIGETGVFEEVAEARFETIVPTQNLPAVVAAYIKAHPYEEAAYDIYPLNILAHTGAGRVLQLSDQSLDQAHQALQKTLQKIDANTKFFVAEKAVHDRDADRADTRRTSGVGSKCIVYAGPVTDIMAELVRSSDLRVAIVSQASEEEIKTLNALGVSIGVLSFEAWLDYYGEAIAGALTRSLTFPIKYKKAGGEVDSLFVESAPVNHDFADGVWRLHFDGGSRGNPGPAAYGWVLYAPNGEEFEADGVNCGHTTNNVAEWTGLLNGLEHAANRGIKQLDVRGDSELVIKQVTGVYRVKNANLKPLSEEVQKLKTRFKKITFKHVYRTDNARADELANEAMDGLR